MKPTTPSNGLSVRANRCLAKAGIPQEKEVIVCLVRKGTVRPNFWPPGYGSKTHAEVCRWLGVDTETLSPADPEGSVSPYPDIGLSYRAWRCLCRAGIPATKEAVLRALTTGALCPGKCPGSYGKITHAEICRWAGVHGSKLRRRDAGTGRRLAT